MAKDKLPIIERQFDKAEKIYKHPEMVKKLKKTSNIRKICNGIIQYIKGSYNDGCITIYDTYHVKGYDPTHNRYTEYIKDRLHKIKWPPSPQLNLFKATG